MVPWWLGDWDGVDWDDMDLNDPKIPGYINVKEYEGRLCELYWMAEAIYEGDVVVGLIGLAGNAWWHAYEDGAAGGWDIIEDETSPYWDNRFDLLATAAGEVEQHQTYWGFCIEYLQGKTSTKYYAPNITVIPEPATIALLGLGGLALLRKRRV